MIKLSSAGLHFANLDSALTPRRISAIKAWLPRRSVELPYLSFPIFDFLACSRSPFFIVVLDDWHSSTAR